MSSELQTTLFSNRVVRDLPQNGVPTRNYWPIAVASGVILSLGGVLLILAAHQILPHGVNAISNLGIWGQVSGYCSLGVGVIIILIGAVQGHLKNKMPVENRETISLGVVPAFSLKEGGTVWLGDEKREIKLGNCVGSGNFKRAIEISDGQVLMLPTLQEEEIIQEIFRESLLEWQQTVNNEVLASETLTANGILTAQSKKVNLYLSADSNEPFPAYISSSFNSLAEQGMYIIDYNNQYLMNFNNQDTSCYRSILKENQDRYAVESWLPIAQSLFQDVCTLIKNKHTHFLNGDALNFVIIEAEHQNTVRLFGFDFPNSPPSTVSNTTAIEFFQKAFERLFKAQVVYDTKKRPRVNLGEQYEKLRRQLQDQLLKK